MSAGSGLDPTFVVATAGGLCSAAAVAIIGTQLLANARAANRHLASGTALTPPVRTPTADGAGEKFGANTALPADGGYSDDPASQQIFAQLNQYYAANISQGNTIFWASLLSMSIGFAIVFVGIVTAGPNSTTAIVGAVAGVLSQFIAATFLVALRSTQQQATTYAQTLVELRLRDVRAVADARSVTLGLRLLNEISDDGANALSNQTRAAIAMGLIVKQGAPFAPGPVDADDTLRIALRSPARTRAESVKFDAPDTARDQRRPER